MEKSESKAREWSDNNLKPVFLPLKRKYWEQFRDGESSVEYRKLGHRWREKAFPSGRGGHSFMRIFRASVAGPGEKL